LNILGHGAWPCRQRLAERAGGRCKRVAKRRPHPRQRFVWRSPHPLCSCQHTLCPAVSQTPRHPCRAPPVCRIQAARRHFAC
jgi:hypothetical protein